MSSTLARIVCNTKYLINTVIFGLLPYVCHHISYKLGQSVTHKIADDAFFFKMRNLMKHSSKYILSTFSEHENTLRRIYDEQIPKRHHKPKDLPDLLAHDIMNNEQLRAMAELAELKLAKKEHHNSTDVIFDAILPEWALAQFCKEFNLTRTEAIRKINNQNEALIKEAC